MSCFQPVPGREAGSCLGGAPRPSPLAPRLPSGGGGPADIRPAVSQQTQPLAVTGPLTQLQGRGPAFSRLTGPPAHPLAQQVRTCLLFPVLPACPCGALPGPLPLSPLRTPPPFTLPPGVCPHFLWASCFLLLRERCPCLGTEGGTDCLKVGARHGALLGAPGPGSPFLSGRGGTTGEPDEGPTPDGGWTVALLCWRPAPALVAAVWPPS